VGKHTKDDGVTAGSQSVLGQSRWAKWHQENRDALNARRKLRYHSDPEYRERVRTAAREQSRLRPRVLVPRVKTQVHPLLVTMVVDGRRQEVLVFHRQAAAEAIGISVERFKLWLRQKFVPRPMYRNPSSGFGMYTRDQIALLQETAHEVVQGQPPTRRTTHAFAALLQARWARLPGGIKAA
jgi:hypothetical protein